MLKDPVVIHPTSHNRRFASFVLEAAIFVIARSIHPFLFFIVNIWEVVCWSRSKTIGKQLMGMRVIDAETHGEVGWWRMLVREVAGKFISAIVFLLGFAWILFDDKHQGWHDKIIGSQVVDDVEVV